MSLSVPRWLLLALPALVLPLLVVRRRNSKRSKKIPSHIERVLIIGATSGIGRTLARQYAGLGVRNLCIVGRREGLVAEVVDECSSMRTVTEVIGVPGDFVDPKAMVRVRDEIVRAWGGLDTVIVAAGVSALRPLMEVGGDSADGDFDVERIHRIVDIAKRAADGNFVGPLVAAVTFIPLLESTSPSPSILLVNSLASVIPAPTRSLYASTKSASLLLYQALSIEHPRIAFTRLLPSTVEGDFRASAVDGGHTREAEPNKSGLKREAVARRCMTAIERGEKNVFMPWSMGLAHLAYWMVPGLVEAQARKKYRFKAV
ncbi:unnamed protein product [Mycena citricolor]|uniref:NAD(P)-binding protein n=1 Tax=Mycena citricolor TaxID=2018698 RepID=A0AAD2HRB5_9AGAR|nr:unnamed protein product [Mycena citricolor]